MIITLLILLLVPVAFSYVGYPLLMRLLARLYANPWKYDDSFTPTISVILAVHNEEEMIVGCLRSIIDQKYPQENIEVLVGSDCSSDRTNTILLQEAKTCASIRPFFFEERRGKMPVLNDLVHEATGEILIFADADIQFSERAFRAHARHFIDPSVGCVSGYLTYKGKTDGPVLVSENGYMSVENTLRKHEAIVSSTIGLFGGNYSLRRSEYREIPSGAVHDDLFAALQIISKGKRTVFDSEAISVEPFVRTMRDEFKRKTRNAGRGFRTLALFPELLSPKAGIIALIIWSHRMLRWMSPLFLVAILLLFVVSHVIGAPSPILDYGILFSALCMGAGFILDKLGLAVPVIGQIYWLGMMNIAFAKGGIRFLLGKEPLLWMQTSRADIGVSEKEAVQI